MERKDNSIPVIVEIPSKDVRYDPATDPVMKKLRWKPPVEWKKD